MENNEMDKDIEELNQSSNNSKDDSLNIYSILNKFSIDEEDEKGKNNPLLYQFGNFKEKNIHKESSALITNHNSSNTQNQHQNYNNTTHNYMMIATPQYYSNQNIYNPYQYPTPMIYNNFQSYNVIRPVYQYPINFPYYQNIPNNANFERLSNIKITNQSEVKSTDEKSKTSKVSKAFHTSTENNIQNQQNNSSTSIKEKRMKYQTIFEIFTYKNNVVRFINSYKGSIKLQELINKSINETDAELVLIKIKPFIGKISNHQFGNYFLQAFVKKVTFKERKQIWNFYLFRNFLDYIKNTFALYVFQALLSNLQSNFDKNELNFIITSLKGYYKDLAYSENGSHLLSKLLASVNNVSEVEIKDLKPLLDYIITDFSNLIVNKNSIIILSELVNFLAFISTTGDIKEIIIKKLDSQGILNQNEYSLFSLILAKWNYYFWFGSITNLIENNNLQYFKNKLIFTNLNFLLILKTVLKNENLSTFQKSDLSTKLLYRMSSKLDINLTTTNGVSVFKECIKNIEDNEGAITNLFKFKISKLVLEEESKKNLCIFFEKRLLNNK